MTGWTRGYVAASICCRHNGHSLADRGPGMYIIPGSYRLVVNPCQELRAGGVAQVLPGDHPSPQSRTSPCGSELMPISGTKSPVGD